VLRFLHAPSFPERKRRRKPKTVLDPYLEYLYRRWHEEECHNGLQLYREIKAQGYSGSPAAVSRYVTALRTGKWLELSPARPPLRSYTPHQAVWLFVRTQNKLNLEEQADLAEFQRRSAELIGLRDLVQRFVALMRASMPGAIRHLDCRCGKCLLVRVAQFCQGATE
jgi:transposase